MYNILVYCDKKNREIIIPEFKKYFDYLDYSLHENLSYSFIKDFFRENLEVLESVFLLNVSREGLRINSFSEEKTETPETSFLFKDDCLIMNYTKFTPIDKILSIIFEMSDLNIHREKVSEIGSSYSFGVLNGQLIYHDNFGETLIKETEKIFHTFFKEDCFSNLFRIKF